MEVEEIVPRQWGALPRFLEVNGSYKNDGLAAVHAHEVDETVVGRICLCHIAGVADKTVIGAFTVSMLDQEDVFEGKGHFSALPAARFYPYHHASFILFIVYLLY